MQPTSLSEARQRCNNNILLKLGDIVFWTSLKMVTKSISCKPVLSRDFPNGKSPRICATLYRTAFLCSVLLARAVTPVSAEVCGGIRNRFICDDHDPSVFHICMGNNQYTMLCPGTLHFNARTQNCDWPESVNCVNEALSRQPTSNTITVPTLSPTSGTKQPPIARRGDHSSSRPRVLPTSTRAPHSTMSQISSTMHTTNAPKLLNQDTASTEAPHSRYRLKVVTSTDKPLESLITADEKVIEEVKKLSEELKHIDNYLKSLDSDNVGFMIEPYMAAFAQKRPPYTHRYPKLEPKKYTASPVYPFRKSSIPSTSQFRKITSPSPYGVNTATYYRSKSTDNPRTHRVSRMATDNPRTHRVSRTHRTYSPHQHTTQRTYSPHQHTTHRTYSPHQHTTQRTYSPYQPKNKLYRTDHIHAAYRLQDTLVPASRYSYRFSNNAHRNNSMGHIRNPYKDPQTVIEAYKIHSSRYSLPASNQQYTVSSGKNEYRFRDGSTSRLVQRTYAPHHSTSKLPSTTSSYRNQGSQKPQMLFDNTTTRKSQMPYTNKTSHRPKMLPSNTSTRRSQILIDKETTRTSQMPFDSNSTRKFQSSNNKTARKFQAQNDNKTTRFQSTGRTSTYKQPSVYKSTPTQSRKVSSYYSQGRDGQTNRHGTQTSKHPSSNQSWWSTARPTSSSALPASRRVSKTTARTSPSHYSYKIEKSHTPVDRKVFTPAKSSTTIVTNPWWSSTKPVSHQDNSVHRSSTKYKQRHYSSRPNYNTRIPISDFVLAPGNERSTSYRSQVIQHEQKAQPFNAPAAVERDFALHSAPKGDGRSFSLYQVNAPASVDRFALHKPKAGMVNREVATQTDKIFLLDKYEETDKDKVISAYKSPVEKYETKQGKCSSSWCKLPDCRCIGPDIPGEFQATEIPQMVMLTFDDSINGQNMHYFRGIFNGTIKNPNGCPIKSTFFVSGDSSDYDMVKSIYKQGHEIASHTVSHRNPTTWWAYAGYENWEHEIIGMRDRLNEKSGVPVKEITGMRAPFLQVGGDAQYAMLKENKFRYDSSMVTGNLYTNTKRPIWPFTLDTPPDSTTCSLTPCPTRSFPGLWEVPLIRWYGSNKMACAMPDACTIGLGLQGTQKFMEDNFKRHYTTNRAPFGIFIHASWFGRKDGNFQGLVEFLRSLADKEDVWVVTVNQALDWIQHPVRLSALNTIQSWAC